MNGYQTLSMLICFLFYPASAFSDETKKYTVGVEGIPFLPYSNVKNQEYYGILRDILDRFSKQAGIAVIYTPLPIKRLYADFYNGKIDFKLPANEYWQKDLKKRRRLSIKYSLPIVSFTDGVMVSSDKIGGNIESIKKLGIISGFTPWEYLDRIKSGKILTRKNPSLVGLLEQGIMGRVDAIYINISVGKYYLTEQLKKENILLFDQRLPHTKSNYHLATIRHPEIIDLFNKFLKNSNKELKLLTKKYGLENE